MRHSEIRESLAIYRDLRGPERVEVDQHVAGCAECRAVLAAYLTMDQDLAALRDARPDHRLRQGFGAAVGERAGAAAATARRRPRSFAFAAPLAGMALLVVLIGAWAIRQGWLSASTLTGVAWTTPRIPPNLTVLPETDPIDTARLQQASGHGFTPGKPGQVKPGITRGQAIASAWEHGPNRASGAITAAADLGYLEGDAAAGGIAPTRLIWFVGFAGPGITEYSSGPPEAQHAISHEYVSILDAMNGEILVGMTCCTIHNSQNPPAPHSSLIGSFVWQTDGAYGYQMLRPAGWEAVTAGDLRKFGMPVSGQRADAVGLTVGNLQAHTKPIAGGGRTPSIILGLFEKNPTFEGWMAGIEQATTAAGAQPKVVRSLPAARIYLTLDAPGSASPMLMLSAYKVEGGQPLAITLVATGTYASLDRLETEGMVGDLVTMVESARAIPLDPNNVVPALNAQPTPTTLHPPTTPIATLAPQPAATSSQGALPSARLLFGATSSGGAYIFSVNLDGSDLRQVSPLPRLGEARHLDGEVACAPDGRQIAFSSWRGNSHSIYGMAIADPQSEVSLVGDGIHNYWSPAWMPDGSGLIFITEAENRFYLTNLLHDHAPLPIAGPNLSAPAVSPDGRRLAYTSGQGAASDIHVANLDGSNDVDLTRGAGYAHQPAWSPDGKQIAFWGNLDGGNTTEIYVMDASGANVRRLNTTPDGQKGRNNYQPAWSPDGKQIAFYSDRDGNGIWIMNADGSGERRITDPQLDATNPCWLPAPPAVAPTRTPRCDLVCRDATASVVLTLTPAPMSTQSPSFRATEDAYNQRVQATETAQAQMTPTPTPMPTATAPSPTPSATRTPFALTPKAVFTDPLLGYALDYPAAWYLTGQPGGLVSVQSSAVGCIAGNCDVRPDESKIELAPQPFEGLNTLEQLVTQLKKGGESGMPAITREETWHLAGGLTAVRLDRQFQWGTSPALAVVIDGHGLVMVCGGDPTPFDAIARTLRPIMAPGPTATATTAR